MNLERFARRLARIRLRANRAIRGKTVFPYRSFRGGNPCAGLERLSNSESIGVAEQAGFEVAVTTETPRFTKTVSR